MHTRNPGTTGTTGTIGATSKARLAIALAAAGGLAVGSLAFTGGTAFAGHEVTILSATLDGNDEVPVKGDPNGRGEVRVFGIDGSTNTLCYVIEVEKIEPATAAHIHEAPEGAAGDVVVTLARPTDGDSAGCVETPLAQEILADPENYYVNVHNDEYPGGAVRGQLSD